MENKLQIVKNNIFTKIVNFFKIKFFPKKKYEEFYLKTENITQNKTEETNNLWRIDIGKHDKRILKLQENFEIKRVSAVNMSSEEIEELHLLYSSQIEELKQKIERGKKELEVLRLRQTKA